MGQGASQSRGALLFFGRVADTEDAAPARPSAAARVDLNADVGESFGPYVIGDDEGLMSSITSAHRALDT